MPTYKSIVMLKQLTLLVVIATLFVSCKKDKANATDDPFVGSWQCMIQLQKGDKWPMMNADSVRAAGNFSYELKRNHTAVFKRVVIPANTPVPWDFILKWKPGMPLDNVHTTPLPQPPLPFPVETVLGYWSYNKEKKQLLIIGSQRQTLETWQLEEVKDRELITLSLVLRLSGSISGVVIKQKVRFIFIKK